MKLSKPRYRTKKSKYDVLRFVYKHFPEARLASSGNEFIIECPWHDGHKKKLYVNVASGVYNCFVCGARGNFLDFVRRVIGLAEHSDISNILNTLNFGDDSEYVDFFESEPVAALSEVSSISYPEGYFPLWEGDIGAAGTEGLNYLFSRGITRNQIFYYKLGFCIGGRYDRRIVIPTFGPSGELVTYVCRDYTGKSPYKVLNPPEVGGDSNKKWVFNLYNALRTGHLIVTEGVFDAMAVGVSGVALFGKKATDAQLAKLVLDRPLRITVCLDADAAEDNEILASQLCGISPHVFIARLPEKDPSGIDPDLLRTTILQAERYEPRWLSIW